jgi:hypothetical protein
LCHLRNVFVGAVFLSSAQRILGSVRRRISGVAEQPKQLFVYLVSEKSVKWRCALPTIANNEWC